MNVHERFYSAVSVEFQVLPASSVTESWDVGQQGSNTFLLPPHDSLLWDHLSGEDAQEMIFRVNGKTYRFDAEGYAAAAEWLTSRCSDS